MGSIFATLPLLSRTKLRPTPCGQEGSVESRTDTEGVAVNGAEASVYVVGNRGSSGSWPGPTTREGPRDGCARAPIVAGVRGGLLGEQWSAVWWTGHEGEHVRWLICLLRARPASASQAT